MVKKLVLDDVELHKIAEILGKIDSCKDFLELRLSYFVFENRSQWQTDNTNRWSDDDMTKAEEIIADMMHIR